MKRWIVFAALLMVISGRGAHAQSDWPMFRGDPGLSGVAREQLAPPLRIAWSSQIGSVEATAAIVGQTVYCATMKGKLFALDLTSGKPHWTFSSVNSFSASPTVAGGIVYIGDEGGVFYALRASTGKQLFKFATGDKIVSCATPAPGGRILFGSWDGRLYCLDSNTGKVRWSFKTEAQVNATPCVAGQTVFIAGCDGKVRAIDLKTGRQLSALVLGGNIGASAASNGKCVFVGTLSGGYLAMRESDRHLFWEMREHEESAACYASAAVTPSAVIFGSRSNRIFRSNPATGAALWAVITKGEVDSSPVISGKYVYAASDDGVLLALDLATGKQLWRFPAGGQIKASPAIGQSRLVIGTTDGMIYCMKP